MISKNTLSRMMRIVSAMAVLISACLLLMTGATAADKQKMIKLGGIGNTYGYVVDAETGNYLDGAKVELLLPSNTLPIRGSTATTKKDGYYKIQASIGSVHNSFATERLLELSVASLLFGGGEKNREIRQCHSAKFERDQRWLQTFYGSGIGLSG